MIIITGPTATGKTALALDYAKKLDGEIINCDSRQVYKYLDIITGKDLDKFSNGKFTVIKKINGFDIGYHELILTDSNQLKPVLTKLWLYDIVTPDQYFSSFDFTVCANYAIQDILKRKKTPIITGGSYFYLKHLLYGLDIPPVPANQKLRAELNKKPVEELQKNLNKLNPDFYNSMNNSDKNNPRRLIRRIEIENNTGSASKSFLPPKAGMPRSLFSRHPFLYFGLFYKNKDLLRSKIISRVYKRLKQGAVEEVKLLLKKRYKQDDPGFKTIGYQQIISFLSGRMTKKDAVEEWITREIQYVKKQMTFMKKDKNIKWKEV